MREQYKFIQYDPHVFLIYLFGYILWDLFFLPNLDPFTNMRVVFFIWTVYIKSNALDQKTKLSHDVLFFFLLIIFIDLDHSIRDEQSIFIEYELHVFLAYLFGHILWDLFSPRFGSFHVLAGNTRVIFLIWTVYSRSNNLDHKTNISWGLIFLIIFIDLDCLIWYEQYKFIEYDPHIFLAYLFDHVLWDWFFFLPNLDPFTFCVETWSCFLFWPYISYLTKDKNIS